MLRNDVDLNKLIDDILNSEVYEEEPVGLNEYFFSEHSRNLNIICQFDWKENFVKEHADLLEYLRKGLKEFFEEKTTDDTVLLDWLYGGKSTIYFDGFLSELDEELEAVYRGRIKESYKCSNCGAEISEAFPFRHSKSLHRIGFLQGDGTYKNNLFCKRCFDSHLKTKKDSND